MRNRQLAWALLVAVTIAPAARAGSPITGFTETLFQGGLTNPIAIAFLPDGRMLVTEKAGALKVTDGTTVSTITTLNDCSAVEMGLLGIAVDPSYATNGFVYLYRTKNPGDCSSATGRFNEVIRITIGAGDTMVAGSLTTLVTGAQTDDGNHDGGCLRIGPDGKLYVGVGDTGLGDNQGGPGSSTNPYAQDLSVIMGKVLRINLDGTIPANNPFVGQMSDRPEIFAYGFRNPFRFGFDPQTSRLWLADVGDLTIEELDIVTSGGNYAWPHCEGTLPASCDQPGDIDPIFTYPHNGTGSLGTCIIGGEFAGPGYGGLDGDYFFGDCTSSNLYYATPNGTRDGIGTPTLFLSNANVPADIVFGPDGALYYVATGAGEVRRVAPSISGGNQLVAGQKLSLRDNTDASRKRLSIQATDAIQLGGPTDDPTVAGGSLRVSSATFDDTYPLPATNWKPIGDPADQKGFKYTDKLLAAGPIKSAMVKAGKFVKASGKGTGLGDSLATNPDPVSIVLTIGARQYCASFGGTVKFTAGRSFTAKLAPAPAACP
jgi:glucose/arabinose dehydrogenase